MDDFKPFDVMGKTALVTGGSTGIGKACAMALARSGADVAISARSQSAGEYTTELLRDLGVDSLLSHLFLALIAAPIDATLFPRPAAV